MQIHDHSRDRHQPARRKSVCPGHGKREGKENGKASRQDGDLDRFKQRLEDLTRNGKVWREKALEKSEEIGGVSEIATRPAQRRKRAAYRQQENEECNRRDVEPLVPGQFGPYCGRGGAAALMLGRASSSCLVT